MLVIIPTFLRNLLRPRRDLLLENLALRQQILVLERQIKKPEFRDRDRAFWVVLSRFWTEWKNPLRLVQPQTVISRHRSLWRKYWKWKSRPKDMGRPKIPVGVIVLIRKISFENPNWGAAHIQGELMMLGHFLSVSTVAKYMVKRRGRPNQNWKTFLRNHLHEIGAINFLTIPTITFKTLYIFIVLSLDRRRVVHFHVTRQPTADWTALQLLQAFPFDTTPKYLIRDRDGICGEEVLRTIDHLGVEDRAAPPLLSRSRLKSTVVIFCWMDDCVRCFGLPEMLPVSGEGCPCCSCL